MNWLKCLAMISDEFLAENDGIFEVSLFFPIQQLSTFCRRILSINCENT